MEWIGLGIAFFVLLVLGCHIGIALGIAGVIYILFIVNAPISLLPSAFLAYMHGYALTAVPLFIFAGYIMEQTEIIKRLFEFAQVILKRVPANLGVATMITCMIFAAITGSSVAMVSAMSLFALPTMTKAGYERAFACGIITSGGTLGLLIPPSLTLIVFGVITETSITKLFLAGMIPGIVLGSLLVVRIIIVGIRRGYKTPLALEILCEGKLCGSLGLLAPAQARELMLTGHEYPVAVATVNVTQLQKIMETTSWQRGEELPKFPSVKRDLALIVDQQVNYADLEKNLLELKEKHLISIVPFDIFSDPEGKKLPLGKKSIALSLTFQDNNRTLTAEEISQVLERMQVHLKESLGTEVRC